MDRRRFSVVVEVVDVLDLRVDGLRAIYDDKTSTARFGSSGADDGGRAGDASGRRLKWVSDGRGVGGNVEDERSPRVAGRMIALKSSVESMYMVMARGAGAIRSRRLCVDSCNEESVAERSRRKSREGLRMCEAWTRATRSDPDAGRLWLIAPLRSSSSPNRSSTPVEISLRLSRREVSLLMREDKV